MNEKKLSRPLISLIVSIALIIVGIAGSFIPHRIRLGSHSSIV